ncbi:MAG: translocation/assembly module TamB domain-containing protein, partial [Chlamydiota bacterium]|nr:translocation/assembly module TamB domain-containing protein [Chlamydiota bacterium]
LKYIIAYYLKSFDIHYDGLDGTLFNGLILKNMSINDIPVLATPNVFSIENMQFRLIPTDPMDIEFEFNNATLRMAGSDTILIYGSYTVANGYDLKVYSKSSNIWPLLYSITHNPIFKKCSGKTTDIDIHITGPNRLLNIKGTSVIQSLQDGPFILTNCPVDIDLNLKDQQKSLHGKIIFNESMIKIKNTVITLKKSTITYKGDINNPELDIQGMSQIDGVRIFILIKGDIESPELILTSNPEFPQDRLLLMLATGQSWSKTEELLQKGEISPELAKDLSHYLLSGNMSQKLASFMGVDTINVGYDLQTKSMEVMKKVGSKSYISYGLEQTNTTQQQNGELKQKVEVGRQLSDVNAIAIEGSKDSIYSEEQNTATNGSANGSESVMLKFKRKF